MELVLNNINNKILNNINMCIFNGKITAIVGNSGCGKSMIAEVISTIRKPDSGSILMDGNLIDFNGDFIDYNMIRFNIGIVLQNFETQLFHDTVRQHILYQLNEFNYKNDDKRIIDSLIMVGLNDKYLNKKIKFLSNGEKFLVALAGILAINPKIIILDDPTSFLDYNYEIFLTKLLKRMKSKYKKTIIICSSNTNFIHSIADYIYILDKGKIVLHGDKYDVFNDKKLEKLSIKVPDILIIENLIKKKAKISIPYRDDINDLIKDIYFYIEKNRGDL